MTCREAIAVLADYLEATLDAETGRRLDHHLEGCDACVAYLRTYRRTRDLAADVARVEMPVEMKARLREFLIATLARSTDSGPPGSNPASNETREG